MHSIYLARIDSEQEGARVAAVRAVRFIRNELGLASDFRTALNTVDALIADRTEMVPVAEHEDYEKLQGLVVEAAEYHQGSAEFVLDPEDTIVEVEQVEDGVDPEDEEFVDGFSQEALKIALVLVNISDDPSAAYLTAMQLGKASDDLELYAEVQAALLDVFQVYVGPQGPEIHIVQGDKP